jgi:hypothetical protein
MVVLLLDTQSVHPRTPSSLFFQASRVTRGANMPLREPEVCQK